MGYMICSMYKCNSMAHADHANVLADNAKAPEAV